MEFEQYESLRRLVAEAIYHSELVNVVASGVVVNVPVRGGMDHLLNIDRRVIAGPGQDAHNEESGAVEVLTKSLAYLLSSAESWETPVFQYTETGEQMTIGSTVIFIDRARLKFPELHYSKDNGYHFLNCAMEGK